MASFSYIFTSAAVQPVSSKVPNLIEFSHHLFTIENVLFRCFLNQYVNSGEGGIILNPSPLYLRPEIKMLEAKHKNLISFSQQKN